MQLGLPGAEDLREGVSFNRVATASESRTDPADDDGPTDWLGNPVSCAEMIDDPDPLVRIEVAERLPAQSLALMAGDGDFRVRFVCAERVPCERLTLFLDDEDEVVRDIARQRLEVERFVMGLGREQEIEIRSAPMFVPGQKVRALKHVKNDGTYRGREIGDILVRKGEVGYVRDIGTFLQQFYIYAVEWVDSCTLVGMRGKELARLDQVAPAKQPLEETTP